jgi:hypothetical protein
VETPTKQKQTIAICGLFLMGCFAVFLDPLGTPQESGAVDFSPTGNRWILVGLGAMLLLGGAWVYFQNNPSRRK